MSQATKSLVPGTAFHCLLGERERKREGRDKREFTVKDKEINGIWRRNGINIKASGCKVGLFVLVIFGVGFRYIVLVVLELSMYTRVDSNSQRFTCV